MAAPDPAPVGLAMLKDSTASVLASEDVRGHVVHDKANQPVGDVDDVVIDTEQGRSRRAP